MYHKTLIALSFVLICSSLSAHAVPNTQEESYSTDLIYEYLYFASAYL